MWKLSDWLALDPCSRLQMPYPWIFQTLNTHYTESHPWATALRVCSRTPKSIFMSLKWGKGDAIHAWTPPSKHNAESKGLSESWWSQRLTNSRGTQNHFWAADLFLWGALCGLCVIATRLQRCTYRLRPHTHPCSAYSYELHLIQMPS